MKLGLASNFGLGLLISKNTRGTEGGALVVRTCQVLSLKLGTWTSVLGTILEQAFLEIDFGLGLRLGNTVVLGTWFLYETYGLVTVKYLGSRGSANLTPQKICALFLGGLVEVTLIKAIDKVACD